MAIEVVDQPRNIIPRPTAEMAVANLLDRAGGCMRATFTSSLPSGHPDKANLVHQVASLRASQRNPQGLYGYPTPKTLALFLSYSTDSCIRFDEICPLLQLEVQRNEWRPIYIEHIFSGDHTGCRLGLRSCTYRPLFDCQEQGALDFLQMRDPESFRRKIVADVDSFIFAFQKTVCQDAIYNRRTLWAPGGCRTFWSPVRIASTDVRPVLIENYNQCFAIAKPIC